MLKLLWGQPNDYLLVQLNFMTCKASVQIFLIICELCKRQAMQGSVGNLSSLATSQVFGGVIVLRLAHHVTGASPPCQFPETVKTFLPANETFHHQRRFSYFHRKMQLGGGRSRRRITSIWPRVKLGERKLT